MLFREGNFLISHRVLFQRYCHLPLLSCYHHSTSQSFTSVPLTLIRRRDDAAIPSFITGSIQFLIFACVFPTLLRWLIYGFVTPERQFNVQKKVHIRLKQQSRDMLFFNTTIYAKWGTTTQTAQRCSKRRKRYQTFMILSAQDFYVP